jgi:hypothetical protein
MSRDFYASLVAITVALVLLLTSTLFQNPTSGGYQFDSLGLSDIRDIALPTGGTGRVGKLPDGRNVVVRSDSFDRLEGQVSQPTLEIQNSDGTRINRHSPSGMLADVKIA